MNIIKGIQLEDNYRLILIEEEMPIGRGHVKSEKGGVHIYYVKDYNNKPVILIDSQGHEVMINKAFTFAFTSFLNCIINIVCFIVKSNSNRLYILTKYIFIRITSLFSRDIIENFIDFCRQKYNFY